MNEETRAKAIEIAEKLEGDVKRVQVTMTEAVEGLQEAINAILKELNTKEDLIEEAERMRDEEIENEVNF